MREATADRQRVILVVDDDEATRAALADVLRDAGYGALTAGSGREALELVCSRHVDAVLLDLVMPDLDGWAVAARMRATVDVDGLPIVVMTAHGPQTLATAPVASGYFQKPISVDALLGVLRRTFSLRGARDDQRSSGVRRLGAAREPRTPVRSVPRPRDSERGAAR